MKRLLILLAGIFGAHLAQANHGASQLNLRLHDNAPFSVAFDNQSYNNVSNNYQLTNVTPGNHFLRVSRLVRQGHGWMTYTAPVTIYEGWVNVPAASNMNALVNNFNQLVVLSVQPLYTGPTYGHPYDPYYPPAGGSCGNACSCGCGHSSGSCGNGCGCGHGNNGYGYGNGYGNGYGYSYGMPAADFEALKNSIRLKSFDSTKLTVAKQGVRGGISAAQVSELIGLMTFESSKLDLAKFAYVYTVDKQNYHVVNNTFTFDSSTTELAQYINTVH